MIVITTMNELPDDCCDCPCFNRESERCRADIAKRYSTDHYRPKWCPLEKCENCEICAINQKMIYKTVGFVQKTDTPKEGGME